MNYNKTEKEKYRQIWENIDYNSGNAVKFADIVNEIIKKDKWESNVYVLEFGCGDGTTISRLQNMGYHVYGNDITKVGLKFIDTELVFESPVWDIRKLITKFPDFFEYTISTDVLEHIPPEMIDQSIENILAVTGYKTIHAICTRECVVKHFNQELHLTIKPLDWWHEQFNRLNTKGVNVVLLDADRLNEY